MFRNLAFAAAAGVFALAASVDAAVISSLDPAAFDTAIIGGTITTETYDTYPTGPFPGTPGVTTSTTGGNVIVTDVFVTSSGSNGIGGSTVGFFRSFDSVLFTFSSAITAFAIDINTFATAAGAYSAVLGNGDVITSVFAPFAGQPTGQFIGVTSTTAFTTVSISGLPGGFSYTLDTLVFGTLGTPPVDPVDPVDPPSPVPLPASFPLALAGLGLLAALRRSRSA